MKHRPVLRLLDKASREDWRQWGAGSATTCPFPPFASPFIGKKPEEVAQIILDNHESTGINGRWFYIADEQTGFDSTFLLVEIPLLFPELLRTVRVFPPMVNREAEGLVTSQGGFQYLLDATRGGRAYHGYEHRLGMALNEEANLAVLPLVRDMDRPVSDINIFDPIASDDVYEEDSADNSDVKSVSDPTEFRGYVDHKENLTYEPSECETITAEDFMNAFVEEPEQNGAIGDDDSNVIVVEDAQAVDANGGHEAREGENGIASDSDEGYAANDHVENGDAFANQSVSDEGYDESGHVEHAGHAVLDANHELDDASNYAHSDGGNDLLDSVGASSRSS